MATPTTEKLREAISEMDCASQGAFSEIATIAKLALASLETPNAYIDPECIAVVLAALWGKALDAENHINGLASEVGCSYKDQKMILRWDAKSKADAALIGRRV